MFYQARVAPRSVAGASFFVGVDLFNPPPPKKSTDANGKTARVCAHCVLGPIFQKLQDRRKLQDEGRV